MTFMEKAKKFTNAPEVMQESAKEFRMILLMILVTALATFAVCFGMALAN